MLKVDIDSNSGFCAGVIRAISKAEDFLGTERNGNGKRLYSLGAIVHNDAELRRLTKMGLVTIDKEDMESTLGERFFHFELKNSSKLSLGKEDYRYDKTLKGEFVRLVSSREDLDEEKKERIISLGLYALLGDR